MRIRLDRLVVVVFALVVASGAHAAAQDAAPASPEAQNATPAPAAPTAPAPRTQSADDVLATLRRTLAWYQQARLVMQSANEAAGGLVVRDDELAVLRILQRSFDTARAQAALLAATGGTTTATAPPRSPRAERRAKIEAAVREDEKEATRLRDLIRTSPTSKRAALEREAAAANNRLDVDRMRLEFARSLEQFDAGLPGADADLAHQIQALQDAVPELGAPSAAGKPVAVAAPVTPPPATGAWAVVHRLLALQRSRTNLDDLARATHGLARDVDTEVQATVAVLRPVRTRLRDFASNPAQEGATLVEGEQQFRGILERAKLLGGVILPLRGEAALLKRFEADVEGWQRTIQRESGHVLQELALELAGVAFAFAVIAVGGVLWRVATMRYVADPYRRRLLLTARNAIVGVAIALVLVFHFTSELTALVTALGFAAAGIAFALQNVILAVAGYFSMVAPNGIRVGDRVSLQGPFGYVHGEVIEIGFVRIRLRELTGERLEPTGRTVVFPNSVVFTGSFFKHPSTPPETARAA